MSAMFIIQQSIYPCDDAIKDEPENNILKLYNYCFTVVLTKWVIVKKC